VAGFVSEWVAGFILECMAGFVGIRTLWILAFRHFGGALNLASNIDGKFSEATTAAV